MGNVAYGVTSWRRGIGVRGRYRGRSSGVAATSVRYGCVPAGVARPARRVSRRRCRSGVRADVIRGWYADDRAGGGREPRLRDPGGRPVGDDLRTVGVDGQRDLAVGRPWLDLDPGAVVAFEPTRQEHLGAGQRNLAGACRPGDTTVLRSSDQGDTWTPVLALQPGSPISYTTLTSHSITEGGGFIWLGTYNTGQSPPYPNYIYRSADDGATWSIVNTTTTHRHIHGLRYNGGKLYVFFGDSSGDGIWVSSDNGATLQPLCTDYACVTIDAAFDPANTFMLFGNDNYVSQNRIVKVALSDGTLTPIMDIPYDSFSTLGLGASTYLVGTTHESGVPIVDPDLHLFASVDGGDSFQDVFQRPIAFPDGRSDLRVQFSYPNGDFPIQVAGYGTIVGRLVPSGTPTVPLNTGLPTVTGTAQVGQTLSGTVGSWTGATSYGQQWQRCSGASCNPIGERDRPDLCAGRGRRRLHAAAPGHRQQHHRPQPARQLGPNSCGRGCWWRRLGGDGLVHAGRRTDVGDGLVDNELVWRLQLPARDQRQPGRLPGRQERRLPPVLDSRQPRRHGRLLHRHSAPARGRRDRHRRPDPKRRHKPGRPLRRRLAPPHSRPGHLLHRPPRQQRQLGHDRHDQRPRHRRRRPTRLQTRRHKPQPPPQTRRHKQLDTNPRRQRHHHHRPRPPRTRALQRHRRQSRRLDNQPRPPRAAAPASPSTPACPRSRVRPRWGKR